MFFMENKCSEKAEVSLSRLHIVSLFRINEFQRRLFLQTTAETKIPILFSFQK